MNNTRFKFVLLSKMNWLGFITFLISTLTFIAGQDFIQENPKIVSVIGVIIGILTIILRFFTNRPITMQLSKNDR